VESFQSFLQIIKSLWWFKWLPQEVKRYHPQFLTHSGLSIYLPTYLGFLDRSRYFFIPVAPELSSRGWVDPVPGPLLLRKSGSAVNRTRDLWICSQELWPLDHRGGPLIIFTKVTKLRILIKIRPICLSVSIIFHDCNVRTKKYVFLKNIFNLWSSWRRNF
jgi:hypothetical protein